MLLRLLATIGRYGTQALAASLFVGLLVPPLAAFARPLLPLTIFVFMTSTFMRVDPGRLAACLRRPGPLGLALVCTLLAPVAIVVALTRLAPPGLVDAGLLLGLAVQAAAPPIMSSPTIALLLRVEPALVFATVLTLTLASPALSPILADAVAGGAVPIDLPVLIRRVLTLVGGAVALAALGRWLVGTERIRRHGGAIDGIGVTMYVVFAVAAMDGVPAALLGDPARVLLYLGMAVGVSALGFAVAWIVLRPVPPSERLVLGYAAGQRNMGLLIAALGASAPPSTFLYFAIAQFPIYLAPQIIRPLARRGRQGRSGEGGRRAPGVRADRGGPGGRRPARLGAGPDGPAGRHRRRPDPARAGRPVALSPGHRSGPRRRRASGRMICGAR